MDIQDFKLKLKKIKKNNFHLFDNNNNLLLFNLENCYLK